MQKKSQFNNFTSASKLTRRPDGVNPDLPGVESKASAEEPSPQENSTLPRARHLQRWGVWTPVRRDPRLLVAAGETSGVSSQRPTKPPLESRSPETAESGLLEAAKRAPAFLHAHLHATFLASSAWRLQQKKRATALAASSVFENGKTKGEEAVLDLTGSGENATSPLKCTKNGARL